MRERLPSVTFTCALTLSPAGNAGTSSGRDALSSSSSFCMFALLPSASGRTASFSGSPDRGTLWNRRSGEELAPRRGAGSPYRCAGPLAATPIATDLPDRLLRPPLRQRDARCARGVILPAQTGPGKRGRRGSGRSSPCHGIGSTAAGHRRAGSGVGGVPVGPWQQIGATLAGAGEGLLPAPGGDPAVIPGQQDRRGLTDHPGRIG